MKLLLVLAVVAACSAQSIDPSGGPTDKQGNMTCSSALAMACGKTDKGKGVGCYKCIKTNYQKILMMASGCSRKDFEGFCGTSGNGATKCAPALKKACGKVADKQVSCFECTDKNSAALDDAGCTNQYIQSFCRGKDTTNNCNSALEKMCPQVQHQGASCFACLKKGNNTAMLQDAGCNTKSFSQYCRAGAPPPTPGSGKQCNKELNSICEASKGQGPACYKCVFSHYSAVVKAGCNGKQYHNFCGSGNQQGVTCNKAISKACGAYKGQKYYCFQCVVSNTDTLKAANCTVDNYDQFCEGRVGNNCTATLRQICGKTRKNEKQCAKCVQKNKATSDAAGCEPSDVDKFCNGPNHPPRTPFSPFGPSPRRVVDPSDPNRPHILDSQPLNDRQ